ncbi:MAG TPA: type II secretion system F family protein [Candidatus Hydrogenedentes bacterium]|nr:type II secretion system F family protein [Candidatus Hydrogenedentota bacterium]HPU96565.1 type II secretion system F family protein [Candidatus Hydrogenedentota bacterium]
MAVYAYKALERKSGKTIRGVVDAESPVLARRKLREQNLYPTWLQEQTAGAGASKAAKGPRSAGFGRISQRDIALMTRQLAVLLKAGMPLVQALDALMEQTSRVRLRTIIFDVRDKVNSGRGLGDALAEHPKVFSALYTNMVRAGETSGALEQVLIRLADIMERQARLRAQILSALAYPAFMALFAVAIIVFMMTVIIPRITRLFERQGQDLPAITKAVINTSYVIGHYWFVIAGAVFGVYMLWRLWTRTPRGRRRWDAIRLKMPLYGTLYLKTISARFARTLGTMLQSGLTMLPALDVVFTVIDNKIILDNLEKLKTDVRRGRDLAHPLKECGLFPPMMIHMIELGQRSGELESMLIQVADTMDEDVRLTIDALVALLEPVIIIVMGLFVGTLVLSILLPIFKMSTQIGK